MNFHTSFICLLSFFATVSYCLKDFAECHHDFDYNEPDGLVKQRSMFPWLGFMRYVHVTTGVPHVSQAPRVVLVQKQFVLGNAKEMYRVPNNFKLGVIIFGHYDRDEDDCGLKEEQARMGMVCAPAYMEMPVGDVIPHPEYSRFRVENSLALLKLLQPLPSQYMIPVCLPTFAERREQRKRRRVFLIDYVSAVPLDFDEEVVAKKTLRLYNQKDCKRHMARNDILAVDKVTRMLCTTGCGVRPGAPIITYTIEGAFELIGLAVDSGPCAHRQMRDRLNKNPPMYIDVYPYISWIINVVTAHLIPLPYPHQLKSVSDNYDYQEGHRKFYGGILRTKKKQQVGWSSRTYMVGNSCFARTTKAQKRLLAFFYFEKFFVINTEKAKLKVMLRLSAGVDCTIECVRMRLPSKKTQPWIDGVGGYNITLLFYSGWFPSNFSFDVGVTGKNTTEEDLRTFLEEIPRPNYCDGIRDFVECHDDFIYDPPDGLLKQHNSFTWLGFIRYEHVTTKTPHVSLAPRVILVQKQFVLGTVKSLYKLPNNYKLGPIVFGQYERDEEDCGLRKYQIKMGMTCGPAYMEMNFKEIIPHPEFSRFAMGNSLALLKLAHALNSNYMTPICLPTISERQQHLTGKDVFMVDYISTVPVEFDGEKLAKKTLKLLSQNECRAHRTSKHLGKEGVTRMLCSTGCGVRIGTPIISHAATGAFELMGLAIASGPCAHRRMRDRLNNDPPVYIDVYPYVTWIVNVITAHIIPYAYPQRFMITSSDSAINRRFDLGGVLRAKKRQKQGWTNRMYMVGNWCYAKQVRQRVQLSFFYAEKFTVVTGINLEDTRLHVELKISAGLDCSIMCLRMRLPNRNTQPFVDGIGGYNITIKFDLEWFPDNFTFNIGLTGKNTSDADLDMFLNDIPQDNYWRIRAPQPH